jgi:hypothetical protein
MPEGLENPVYSLLIFKIFLGGPGFALSSAFFASE